MNKSNPKCNQSRLEEAILQTLDGKAETQLAEHLSDCGECREKLANFAGEESFWAKATSNLAASVRLKAETNSNFSSSVFVKIDPNSISAAAVSVSEFPDYVEDVPFESPTHPEMLGRVDGFSIEQMIGRGGMGVVYKGFDAELNRPVAIKFLAPHLSVSGVARKRFAREAQAAAAVVHPNVVPIYSIGTSKKRPYIVMALVSGRSLQKHVEETGPLSAEDVVRIAQQIASGLSAAHEQGLVHRDIKPANILLEKDVSRVLITDFGLARAADDAGLTQSGWLAGTPHYMSPEQSKGEEIDLRSDLFSLGSVMYFMATGREPFRAENPYGVLQKIGSQQPASARSVNSQVPKTLDELISKLLQKDPDERFDSAGTVQETLKQYLAHMQNPTQYRRPEFGKPSEPKSLVAPLVLIAAALALFSLLSYAILNAGSSSKTTVRSRPSVPRTNPSEFINAKPAWISNLSESERWDAAMSELRVSATRMKQPIQAPEGSDDLFEQRKSELRDRIRSMQRSFGM